MSEEDQNEININRMEWLKGAAIAIGTFGINHWYRADSGACCPIVKVTPQTMLADGNGELSIPCGVPMPSTLPTA